MRKTFVVLLVSIFIIALPSGPLYAAQISLPSRPLSAGIREEAEKIRKELSEKFKKDEIIVKFAGQDTFVRLPVGLGETVENALQKFRSRGDVVYAEPNYIAYALSVPNDPYYHLQWNLDNPINGGIGWEEAREIETGAGVSVAVIDTGVAYETYTKVSALGTKNYYQAPDLAATQFAPGYDFVEDDTHPNDDEGHGTHVAGTIAQSTGNSVGVAGVAPGAIIMPIKVLDSEGSGTYADVAEGIRWAADNGAKVINLSLGGSASATYLEEALAYAYNKGVTIVAASGNDASGTVSYPAAYNAYVIAVGATRFDNTRAPYSNYGTALDVVAPGGDASVDQNGDGYIDGVLQQTFSGALNNWGYYFYQGTSMATPHVAGVAALVIAHNPGIAPADVRARLQNTARDLGTAGQDNTYGYGLVDAYAALQSTATTTPPPPPPPPPPVTPTVVFTDSFESGINAWTQDSQRDWFSSTQRARDGSRSAEVDGHAYGAALISPVINLSGYTHATTTFSWYIESGFDTGEYVAFDISVNGGTWKEYARVRGNSDPENSWRAVSVTTSGASSIRFRFRGIVSDGTEDANIDNIRVAAQ